MHAHIKLTTDDLNPFDTQGTVSLLCWSSRNLHQPPLHSKSIVFMMRQYMYMYMYSAFYNIGQGAKASCSSIISGMMTAPALDQVILYNVYNDQYW